MQRGQFSYAVIGLLVAICFVVTLANAQEYPSKTISLVVGFPPGGSVDPIARAMADGIGKETQQTVIVETKTGAAGMVAANFVAKSKPDGYTLLLGPGTLTLSAATYKAPPFDVIADFEWISGLTNASYFIAVSAQSPFRSLGDVVTRGKSNPETLKYGTVGLGSTHHLIVELLSRGAGAKFIHVPYRGEGPVMAALQQGEVDFAVFTPTQMLGGLNSGAVRALANTSGARSPRLPDVGTVQELLGLKDFDIVGWFGIMGPNGVSPEIVARLNAAIRKTLQTDETINRLQVTGGEIAPTSPSEMRTRAVRELAVWTKLVEEVGLEKQ